VTEPTDPARWRAVERVLDAALDLPPGERPVFLDEACGSDAALRAEVESLLSAHEQAHDYLERPVASVRDALASAFRPGQRVGPYRLLGEIGRGGLGVVFLAADARLDRKVALKLLPAWRSADPEARARFRREAMAAAALDHPGVCTVYEIGDSDDEAPYIAMAYVEGESLRDRIARGPLSVATAIDIAIQMASALGHAHERGIVHRDIKPANVMVTPEGEARLVDFGIAKLKGAATALTRQGATPGTVAYMSPEQTRGGEVDQRTDIWATGVVLYEMIAGRPPFGGDNEQARAYGILNQDPDPLASVRPGIPRSLDRIVARALAKDPARRYRRIGELSGDLEAARDRPHWRGPARPRGFGALRGRTGRRVLLGALLAAAGLAAVAFVRGLGQGAASPLYLSILLPPGQELFSEQFRRFAVSPDGTQLVYVEGTQGHRELYHRSLDSARSPRPVPGTEGALDPFFSPDGRWVGFFADEELRKVSLDGGAPQRITGAPTQTSRGAAWGTDGTIILPLGQTSGLFRVSENGGVPDPLTVPGDARGGAAHFFPQILPGGRSALFTTWRPEEGILGAAMLDLETGEWEEIAGGCFGARYSPTGHLVCAEVEGVIPTGNLLVAPFTPGRHEPGGPFASVPMPESPGYDFALSGTGTLVYAVDTPPLRRLTWVDRDGRRVLLGDGFGWASAADLSPDGSRVAFALTVETGRQELWLYDVGAGTSARVSGDGSINNMPLWFPDGERVVFNSLRSPAGIYGMRPDGGDSATLVLRRRGNILVPGSFSSDQRVFLYTELHPRTLGDIWVHWLDDGSDTPLILTPHDEKTPMLSPDDRWLAYASDESGRDEVYVRPFPGPGAPIQVSAEGGREPLWSPDGTELFFRWGDTLMAAPVRSEPTFSAGRAVRLFGGRYEGPYIGARNYDVGPDGRFLMVHVEPTSPQDRLEVVVNWFDEIQRIAPGGGSPES
jgi:Tol biopolymer transport system component